MNVLNPDLYRRLQAHFGAVRVVNPGEEMVFDSRTGGNILSPRAVRGGRLGGRPKYPRVIDGGEQYMINCPRCNDTRMRLAVNHRFPELPFVFCHNEDCYAHPPQRDQLKLLLFATRTPPAPRLNRGHVNPDAGKPTAIPCDFEFLSDLPTNHKACAYLLERGFDLPEVCELYGVGYCGDDPNPYVRDRIIVPIVQDDRLWGWQARFVGERDWRATHAPKYYTAPGMRKSEVLYGIDQAKLCPYAVLVEGVTDVWSVGPCAVALLGKTVSYAQGQLIALTLRNRPLVVMLDADARAANARIVEGLRCDHPAGVVLVDLPVGTDPGSRSRRVNLEMIRDAARLQGVNLHPNVEGASGPGACGAE